MGEGRRFEREKGTEKRMRRQRSRSFFRFFSAFFSLSKALNGPKRVCDPRAYRSRKLLSLTFEAEPRSFRTCRTRDKSPVAPDEDTGAWTTCANVDVADDVSAAKPLTRTAGGATAAATGGEPRQVGLLSDDEGVTLALLLPPPLFCELENERAALAARRLEGSDAWVAEPAPPNSSFAEEELGGLTKGTTELFCVSEPAAERGAVGVDERDRGCEAMAAACI